MKFKALLLAVCALGFFTKDSSAQCSTSSQPYLNCTWGDQIDAIKINNISSPNSSGCSSGGYGGVFSSPNWLFVPGATNTVSMTVGGGSYDEGAAIWIDLNQNGAYESNEQVWASSTYGSSLSGTFTIPATALSGNTKMRVRCAWDQTLSSGDMCSSSIGWGYGETEDYNVTICTPPSITQQPMPSFACENGKGIMVAAASKADNYLWQVNTGNGWTDVTPSSIYSNVNGDTLKFDNTPATLNGADYRVIAYGCSGGSKDTSDDAKLDVFAITEIESQTVTDTSCVGLRTKMFVKSKGVINNYQWQIFDPMDTTYKNISNNPFVINFDTLNVNNIPSSLDGSIIRVIANGQCGSDTSKDMSMVVHPLPEVIQDPVDINAEQDDDVKFNIGASGVNLKYQWQVGHNDTFVNVNNSGVYTGVKTDQINVKGVSRAQNEFQFRCIIAGSGSCAVDPDTSEIALLYVNFPASINDFGSDATITMYPNPVTAETAVLKVTGIKEATSYTIIDKAGRIVSNGVIDTKGTTNLNLSNLHADTYHLQVSDNQGVAIKTLKFTKL